MDLRERLLLVERKVDELLSRNQDLSSKNIKLFHVIQNLEKNLSEKDKLIAKFEEHGNAMGMLQLEHKDIEEIKTQISTQLELVNQCIDWLQNDEE